MKLFNTKSIIVTLLLMGCCAQPIYAQAWVKSTSKGVKKLGEKVIKKATTKEAQKAVQKGTSKAGSSVSNSAAKAGTAASQHVHEVTCTSCRGNGTIYYNGFLYKCSTCNGRGKVLAYK